MKCQRCGKEVNTFKTSFLNLEEICLDCEKKERLHAAYSYAKEVEREHVLNGDMNFPGVLHGLVYNTENEANLMARLKYGDTDKNLYDAWDQVLNSLTYKPADIARMMKDNGIDYYSEAKSWIAYMATSTRGDLRNEASHKACKEIKIEFAMITNLTKIMSKLHPTLQQQYTATVLSYYKEEPVFLPFI